MYYQLWFCPLKIACLYKICNSVDVASTTENLFCTSVSVVSELISHYPGLLIGWSALPCLFQSPIFFPIDQCLSYGVAYFYRLWIRFLFYWPWPFLSLCPPSIPEPVQWKHLTLIYQTHGFPSHIYIGSLEVRMVLCSQQYWYIDEIFNLSYIPPPFKKSQKIFDGSQ